MKYFFTFQTCIYVNNYKPFSYGQRRVYLVITEPKPKQYFTSHVIYIITKKNKYLIKNTNFERWI